jgi:hypothetical protein
MAAPLLLAGQNALTKRRVVDAVTNFSVPCLLNTCRPPTTLPTCSIDSPVHAGAQLRPTLAGGAHQL